MRPTVFTAHFGVSSQAFKVLLFFGVSLEVVAFCPAQACKAPDASQSISTDRPSFTIVGSR